MSDASLTPSTEDSEGSEPTLRRMVDRAVAELRRGDAVMMRPDRGPALLIHAAELADRATMERITRLTGHRPMLIVTGQRAVSLGIWNDPTGVAVVAGGADEDPEAILDLVDPARVLSTHHRAGPVPAELRSGALAACRLLKLARLLPAVLASPVERPMPA
ncbi:MAG: hypothetical protein KDA49_00280, partial [Rhodospirillaceae bacterium]|nr:hypothetical protein [Rhodospirillaceae bacterium]